MDKKTAERIALQEKAVEVKAAKVKKVQAEEDAEEVEELEEG